MKLKNEQFSQKFQQVFKNEKDEILQAAEETIKTLTEMLESKKSQLVVKDRQIEKMRQEQLEQKEAHLGAQRGDPGGGGPGGGPCG